MQDGRIQITVSAGPIQDPVFGYSKDDFLVPEEGEEPGAFLMRVSAETMDVLDEAKASIERQARYFAGLAGSEPGEGS